MLSLRLASLPSLNLRPSDRCVCRHGRHGGPERHRRPCIRAQHRGQRLGFSDVTSPLLTDSLALVDNARHMRSVVFRVVLGGGLFPM